MFEKLLDEFIKAQGKKEEPFCHIPNSKCGNCGSEECIKCNYAITAFLGEMKIEAYPIIL